MLVIRLSRVGKKHQAAFRVTVAEKMRTPTGKFVAQIGHYNPHSKEFAINKEKLDAYLKNGAQPSSAIVKLCKRNKIALPKWAEANLVIKNKKPKVKKKDSEAPESKSPDATEAKAGKSGDQEEPVAADGETKAEAETSKEDTGAIETKSEAKPAEGEPKAAEAPQTDKPVESAKPAEKPTDKKPSPAKETEKK